MRKPASYDNPYEDDEQITVVEWCEVHKIPVHHSPNTIGGSTPALKARARRMHRLGTSKGFPDLLVFVPYKGVTGAVDSYQCLAIEMKRRRGGKASEEQLEWLEKLELAGIPSRVCHGADEAISFIKEWLK